MLTSSARMSSLKTAATLFAGCTKTWQIPTTYAGSNCSRTQKLRSSTNCWWARTTRARDILSNTKVSSKRHGFAMSTSSTLRYKGGTEKCHEMGVLTDTSEITQLAPITGLRWPETWLPTKWQRSLKWTVTQAWQEWTSSTSKPVALTAGTSRHLKQVGKYLEALRPKTKPFLDLSRANLLVSASRCSRRTTSRSWHYNSSNNKVRSSARITPKMDGRDQMSIPREVSLRDRERAADKDHFSRRTTVVLKVWVVTKMTRPSTQTT